MGLDFGEAVEALRAADSSNPDTWKTQNAEVFFAYMFGEYLRLEASPERLWQREEDTVATITLVRRLPVEQMLRIRKEVRQMLRDHGADYERLKTTFLMLDLWPENRDRFPIGYAEALQLHAHIRTLVA